MQVQITHRIQFTYTEAVFLEPHTLRLHPRTDSWQRLLAFDLSVKPTPAGVSSSSDLHGNTTARAWFEGMTDSLTINTSSAVETLRTNPFDYLLDPDAVQLPVSYEGRAAAELAPYCRSACEPTVREFAVAIASEVDWETSPFLIQLANRVKDTCESIVRPQGDPWSASVTLARRTGACRDLTVLFMEACRSVGLAARFVSGYRIPEPLRTEPELHAWAEIYLPGAGWRGYDPMYGLSVSDANIALAAGPMPENASPTTGTFRGRQAMSTMETAIQLAVITDAGASGDRNGVARPEDHEEYTVFWC